MKTASLLYPYDSVFKLLKVILARKRFAVLSIDNDRGTILAETQRSLFRKSKTLDIRIRVMGKNMTDITLSVNSNLTVYDKPTTEDEHVEEELLNIINKYF